MYSDEPKLFIRSVSTKYRRLLLLLEKLVEAQCSDYIDGPSHVMEEGSGNRSRARRAFQGVPEAPRNEASQGSAGNCSIPIELKLGHYLPHVDPRETMRY